MSFRNRTIFSVQSLDDVSVQQIPNPGRNAVSRLEIMLADIGTDIITNGVLNASDDFCDQLRGERNVSCTHNAPPQMAVT